MIVDNIECRKWLLTLLDEELAFLQTEAKANNVTVEELMELVLGLFFMQGYKVMFGTE